jgi:tetratricopeptide (TPR) repeat protein
MLVAAAWGAAHWRRSGLETALRTAFVVIVVFAAVHAATGHTRLLGVVPTSLQGSNRRFFAPFIDPNHLGTAIVLLLPAVLTAALDPLSRQSNRLAWGAAASGGVAMLFWIASSGAMVAAAVVFVWVGVKRVGSARVRQAMPVLASVGVAAGLGWVTLVDPRSGATFGERVAAWGRGLRVLPGWWFAGTGGGTFSEAQQPLHQAFDAWAHAHSDFVEWLVEYGLVGLVAAAAAGWLLRPRAPVEDWRDRADVLVVGIAGVLVHAAVDFPLQIPAIAMGVAAMWGLRRAAFEKRVEVPAGRVRAAVIPFVALELLASGWELRTDRVDQAVAVVRSGVGDRRQAVDTLRRYAWWRPELGLADAIDHARLGGTDRALVSARAVVAAHPEDPRALRSAGLVLARNGAPDEAAVAFERAIGRYPGDWRTWVARAQAAKGDAAVEAWKDAFRHGAPPTFLEQAWSAQPLSLVWIDFGSTQPARFSALLGRFLYQHGDWEASALAYEQVWMLEPTYPPDASYPAVLLKGGRVEEAARVMEAFLPVTGRDLKFRKLEAEVLEARGSWDAAADVWTSIAKEREEYVVRAIRAVDRDRGPTAALDFAREWALLHPLDDQADLERARLYLELGDRPRCAQQIRELGRPSDPAVAGPAASLLRQCEVDRP